MPPEQEARLKVLPQWVHYFTESILRMLWRSTNELSQPSGQTLFAKRERAGMLLQNGKADAAADLFREVYAAEPTNRIYLGEYGRALVAAGRFDELTRVATAADFGALFERLYSTPLHDLSPHERAVFVEICNEACQGPPAIAQLCRAVEHLVHHRISGDVVECGVYRGASIVAIIRTLQMLGVNDRDVWLYDTFAGMPKPQSIDRYYGEEEGDSIRSWEQRKLDDGGSNWVRAELADVQEYVSRTRYPENRLHFIKGLVESTIPDKAPEQISLLRLDTDFYSSTKHELVHLYPRVVSGGVVIIDDYGAYRGSRQATDEYLKENNICVLLSRIDEHVRMFVKP